MVKGRTATHSGNNNQATNTQHKPQHTDSRTTTQGIDSERSLEGSPEPNNDQTVEELSEEELNALIQAEEKKTRIKKKRRYLEALRSRAPSTQPEDTEDDKRPPK